MAPTKVLIDQQQLQRKMIQKTVTGKVVTRSQANFPKKLTTKDMTKRKADQLSPPKGKTTKRSALNESTNFVLKPSSLAEKNIVSKKSVVQTTITQKTKETTKIVSTIQPKISVYVDSKSHVTSKAGMYKLEENLYFFILHSLAFMYFNSSKINMPRLLKNFINSLRK